MSFLEGNDEVSGLLNLLEEGPEENTSSLEEGVVLDGFEDEVNLGKE